MAAISTRLQQSLSAEFGIPTDVTFLFKRKEDDGSTKIGEIRAHKHILALASDVFKNGFYGGWEDNGSIEIIDVTKEVFEGMINFIYDKETTMSNYDLDMLCSIYYLADKYSITALEEKILEAIECKEIAVENVIDVGILAIQHAVHDKLPETLLEVSAQRLSKIFKGDQNKVGEYLSEIDAEASHDLIRYSSVLKIMARMKKMCVNCKVSPCISGERLSRANFVPGAKIKCSDIHIGNSRIDHGFQLGDGERFKGVEKNGDYCSNTCTLWKYVFNCKENS